MLKELTFLISAENHPDLLARTVMLLHRLHIPIHGLTMQRPAGASRMRLTVQILAETDDSDRIVAQLAKIAHVVSIEARKQKERPVRIQRDALVDER